MKKIKLVLLKLMGERKYLHFVATSFQRLFKTGRLGKEYQDIYFLKQFIRQGNFCVDSGAHLGYYTFELSRLVGPNGKLIAVEPVAKFHDVLQKIINLKAIKNIKLIKVALGGEGKLVEIGIPRINKEKKFGYARIRQLSEHLEYAESESVENVTADDLLKDLPRLDFIKCDVEGAEVPVFQSMLKTIQLHLPIILAELADKNERIKMYDLLKAFDYNVYVLREKQLVKIDVHSEEKAISHNHYFVPDSKLSIFNLNS